MEDSGYTNHNDMINVSSHLKRMARIQPYKKAVICPAGRDQNDRVAYTHLTFQQLDQESDCIAHGLKNAGISRGVRTILMVKPGLTFFSLTFALFKTGAIPVVVDPGMGIQRMLRCFRESGPTAFIGIPKAHLLRTVYPKFFKTVKIWVTVGKRWFWRGLTMKDIRPLPWKPYPVAETSQDETAAILFTTGSTGPAKGVIYTHGIFNAQIHHIQSHFGISSDEIDLPTFPLFALFDPALGMTAVIPDMDPTKPAQVNPAKIVEAITDHGVTNMFASPALLNRVGTYGSQRGIRLPSLKRVISAGAPVSPRIVERFVSMLSEGAEVHTPYGATEAMPVLSIGSTEILSETGKLSERGSGNCVGYPLSGIDVRIIGIDDHPIEKWSENLILPNGEVGEIVVKGDIVTRRYFGRPGANALAKIHDGHEVWHRMGDLGWMDEKGRIWFCGRKNHRVITEDGTLFTVPCEAIFNSHPAVYRSALIGVQAGIKQRAVICIEPKNGCTEKNREKLREELLDIAKSNELTKRIQTILFHKAFPVDIRHNSKIFREQLAVWAEKQMKSAHEKNRFPIE